MFFLSGIGSWLNCMLHWIGTAVSKLHLWNPL